MKLLENTRERTEHDILIMQAQIVDYQRKVKVLRLISTIFVIALAAELMWMLPSFMADIGPNTPPLKDWTPVRAIFGSIFVAFTVGFVLLEAHISKTTSYVKNLGGWTGEKKKRLAKIA